MIGRVILIAGWVVALVPTVVRHYLVWPWPGSQRFNWIRLAYVLHRLMPVSRIVGLTVALAGGGWWIVASGGAWPAIQWTVGGSAAVAIVLFFLTRIFAPVHIFLRPRPPRWVRGSTPELPPETLVLGLALGREARAYPLRLLGFHHQVDDVLDGEPVHVSYCSVCRSGRVFKPVVEGRRLSFDLIGTMRNNSVYEDRETRSWWVQARGEAVLGPLRGARLPELRADPMTLERWLELHPESPVLAPDPTAGWKYRFYGFGNWDHKREKEGASPSWRWVVGVVHDGRARAYPWSHLSRERLIQDELAGLPLAVHLDRDRISVRVWDRRLDDRVVELRYDATTDRLVDPATGTVFGFAGVGVGGTADGCRLRPVNASVEFWHSFQYFSGGELWQPPADGPEAVASG